MSRDNKGLKHKKRFRKRYVFYGLFVAYLIMCQSCMTMRFTPNETQTFFLKTGTAYTDSTFLYNGHKLHYIATGAAENPILFFIHGSPGSWNAYKDYLKDSLLLKKFRMVAVDRPGFGYSDFGKAEDLNDQGRLLHEFIKTFGTKKQITLIGHSLGGPVAVKLAVMDPERYRNIVILSGSVDPKAEKAENWRPVIKMPPFRYLIPVSLRAANDELWWLKQDLYDMRPLLKNLTAHVVIIHGTKDNLVPYSNVAFMKKEFTGAKSIKIISIKNANHFIPWEHFGIIRDALLELE